MATSKNGKKHSTVRPAPDQSSLRSVAPNRSATVTEYDIARRAYELYLARDCEDGRDVDDWLQAERELQRERGASMNRDELEGKARAAVGRTKRKVGDAIEQVGNVLRK